MTRSTTSQNPASRCFPFLLTQQRRTQGYREWLTPAKQAKGKGGDSLTMLWIPPGRFLMGSPADEPERSDAEGPQHEVRLQGFFMGQTPVTQAQWQAVARWRPSAGQGSWSEQLDPDPILKLSEPKLFRGAQRPVVNVSWAQAMAFCRRLSQRTGRYYTLPSEAQWEYACRAGTSTAFHFGAMLTTELANYDGNYTYEDGQKGVYRNQTTDVMNFPANAWGLHDMHGNAWEWCLDQWHDNYEGAPNDGSAWVDDDTNNIIAKNINIKKDYSFGVRLLRGGSWFNFPGDCRSAFRDLNLPDSQPLTVGFRVCCLPQD
jgi:formylglycine-generating enzyme required for sulfatase activity